MNRLVITESQDVVPFAKEPAEGRCDGELLLHAGDPQLTEPFLAAFFAGGNGGQVVMGIPELDLLVTFFAGNYSDRENYIIVVRDLEAKLPGLPH